MLCTIPDPQRPRALGELRRVLRDEGDLGLLVFVDGGPLPGRQPEGNDFPTEEALSASLDTAGFMVIRRMESDGLAQEPAAWQERADAVEELLARRHGDDPRWQPGGGADAADLPADRRRARPAAAGARAGGLMPAQPGSSIR